MSFLSAKKGIVILTNIIILWCLQVNLYAQTAPKTIRFGFYTKDMGGANLLEMDQSFKLWVETIMKNSHEKALSSSLLKTKFYDSKTEMMDDISKGNLDFLNLSTYDFFDFNLKNRFIPLLTASKSKENKYDRFLLITNKNKHANDISEITDAQIIIPNSFAFALTKIWIQTELKNRLPKASYQSVKIIETSKKENEILFSIFFNKTDYAIINENTYLVASEINPQIKKNTKILASSENYINNFFLCRNTLDPKIYEEVARIGINMDKVIEGKQILNLMQMTSAHTIELSDLNETEELIKQYKKLFPHGIK